MPQGRTGQRLQVVLDRALVAILHFAPLQELQCGEDIYADGGNTDRPFRIRRKGEEG